MNGRPCSLNGVHCRSCRSDDNFSSSMKCADSLQNHQKHVSSRFHDLTTHLSGVHDHFKFCYFEHAKLCKSFLAKSQEAFWKSVLNPTTQDRRELNIIASGGHFSGRNYQPRSKNHSFSEKVCFWFDAN